MDVLRPTRQDLSNYLFFIPFILFSKFFCKENKPLLISEENTLF